MEKVKAWWAEAPKWKKAAVVIVILVILSAAAGGAQTGV